MKFVLIFGGIAVGKMTVAQELAKITDLRLFHNHMTIEPVIEIFGAFNFDVISCLRDVIFEEFVKTDSYGMVYTGAWALENPDDWEYFGKITERFTRAGGEVSIMSTWSHPRKCAFCATKQKTESATSPLCRTRTYRASGCLIQTLATDGRAVRASSHPKLS